jgi:hypothetical protein
VVASDERRGLPVRQLLHCKLAGIKVNDFLDFWERETRTIDLEALKSSWLFYSDGFRCGPVDEFVKRAFDIAVSLCVLLLTLPLLAATACLTNSRAADRSCTTSLAAERPPEACIPRSCWFASGLASSAS